jgi:hypothetical protein
MPVQIKLKAGIFDRVFRAKAVEAAVSLTAKQFAEYVPQQQIKSKPTGKTDRRKGRTHRASARGQRPAPDTFKLARSTKAKKIGTYSWEVTTAAKRDGFDYAEHLQEKMDRPIQNAPEDEKERERLFKRNMESVAARLAK